MVETSVEKLWKFCSSVCIAGNREDLSRYAQVVRDEREDAGPAAGMEAGLLVANEEWSMFLPVDVPLVPAELLRRWAEAVMERGVRASYLRCGEELHPALCMLHRDCLPLFRASLEGGERKLTRILEGLGAGRLWVAEAAEFAPEGAEVDAWFANVNTPEDLAWANGILGERDGAHG
jgi:molybdopterin-guanine dinucleotide biosynthesis protein A